MSGLKIRGLEQHVQVPIIIELPDEEEVKFTASYVRMTISEQKKMVKQSQGRSKKVQKIQEQIETALEAEDDDGFPDIDDKLLEGLGAEIDSIIDEGEDAALSRLKGWDLKDSEDNPVEFNKANLKEVVDSPVYRLALVSGVWSATGGRIKN